MNTNQTIDIKDLSKFDALSELTDDELKRVAAVSRRLEYGLKDRIFEENAAANALYFLDSGRVGIQIELGSERHIVVETVSPGECFGWGALVEPCRYTASAVCVDDSTVIAADGRALREMIAGAPHLGFVLMSGVARIAALRLKDTRLQLISVAYGG